MSRAVTVNYGSTSTGASGAAYLYGVFTKAHTELISDSTKDIQFTVQGRVGGGSWQSLSTTTTSTGGVVSLTSGTKLFDQLRANVSANASTSTGNQFIFAGAH
jgi:hypothetical protein